MRRPALYNNMGIHDDHLRTIQFSSIGDIISSTTAVFRSRFSSFIDISLSFFIGMSIAISMLRDVIILILNSRPQSQVQVLQLFLAGSRRSAGQEAGGLLGFGKGDNVADG